MKLPWLIIVFLLVPFTFAQAQFEGMYCAEGDYYSECIHFHQDGTFEFRSADCTRSDTGSGNYTIIHDTLSLHFSAQTPFLTKYEIEFSPAEAYYSEIEYWAFWVEEKDSCIGCKIEFYNQKNELIAGGYSMGNDVSVIQIARNKNIDKAIASFNSDSISIPLQPDTDAQIKVYFPSGISIIQNETIQYTIKQKRPRRIMMARIFEHPSPENYKPHCLRFKKH